MRRTLRRSQRPRSEAGFRFAILGVAASLGFGGPGHAQTVPDRVGAAAILLKAYPETLAEFDGTHLVTRSGQRIAVDAAGGVKSHADRLDRAGVLDMFAQRYPPAGATGPPAHNDDPGRAKSAALFDALYGDCTKGEVAKDLVAVPWLAGKGGGTMRVTRRHGVAAALAAVSRDLETLPASFDKYLLPAGGGYNCRDIAGTSRKSGHGWGIAIDLAPQAAHYWRWHGRTGAGAVPDEGAPGLSYKNTMPPEIVRVFEKHGFIWGGRWYHYDTMHFEYRPELFAAFR